MSKNYFCLFKFNKKYCEIISSIILTFLIILFECCNEFTPSETGNVVLKVLDNANSTPIPYASIVFKNNNHLYWGATNSNGLDTLLDYPTGPQILTFYAANYLTTDKIINFDLDDQYINIYIQRLPFSLDTVRPEVIGYDVRQPDIYLLFSKKMNINSVEFAIKNANWTAADPCHYNQDTTSTSYYKSWNQFNILHISHDIKFIKYCSNDSSYHSSYYNLKLFVIDTTATDYTGNHLKSKFIYQY